MAGSVTAFVTVFLVVLVMTVMALGRLVTFFLVMMMTTLVFLLRAMMILESRTRCVM